MQQNLKTLGYYTGSVDGDYGSGTTAAVTAFQQSSGLKADGIAGKATLNAIYVALNGGSSGGSSSGSSSSPDNYGKTASSNGYTTITTGSSSSNVTALQSALQATGYYSGSVDGSYGSGTEAAVEAYQRAAGLRVTGMAGPTTQRLLYGGTSESGSYSKLDVGSTGSAVKRLQYALYELKYYDGDISGTYDTVTQNAVMVFQELNGLSIDGVAGQQTQQKLFSSNAVPAASNPVWTDRRPRPAGAGAAVLLLYEEAVNFADELPLGGRACFDALNCVCYNACCILMLDGGSDMFGKMMNRYYYGKSGKGDYTKEDLPQTRWQLFWEMLRVRLSGLIRLNLMYAVAWLPAIFVIGRGLLLWYAGLANVADAQMQLEAGEITAEALAEMTQSYTQGHEHHYHANAAAAGALPGADGAVYDGRGLCHAQLGARRAAFIWSDFIDTVKGQLEIWPADGGSSPAWCRF